MKLVGLASTDANAGARKMCKQWLEELTRWRASTRESDEAVQSRIQSSQEGRSGSPSDIGSKRGADGVALTSL